MKKLAEKHRYNLIMSMDDPVQREAWEIICRARPGTRNKMVCNAIVKQDFAESLREMIRDELSKVSFVQQEKAEPDYNPPEDDAVLDFLFALQNGVAP